MAVQRRTREQVGKKKVLMHRVKRRTAKKKNRQPVNPPDQRAPLAPRRYGPY